MRFWFLSLVYEHEFATHKSLQVRTLLFPEHKVREHRITLLCCAIGQDLACPDFVFGELRLPFVLDVLPLFLLKVQWRNLTRCICITHSLPALCLCSVFC